LAPVLGGAPSRSRSSASAVLLLGPFLGLGGPRFFGLALVLLLGSSPHHLQLGAPHETFGLALVLLLGSSVFSLGSSVNLRSQCSSSVLSSGTFLFCSTICHPFLNLHFTHSTSTSLSHPTDCYFLRFFLFHSSLISLHSFFALFFTSFPFTLFPFDYDSLRYKINLIKYPFSNQTKSNKNTIVTSKKNTVISKNTTVIFSNYGLNN
jgi:hypothetical protein